VLFNEPKLLKFFAIRRQQQCRAGFSALQRAEIAEIEHRTRTREQTYGFSALQRAEIAEIFWGVAIPTSLVIRFSALQRAEIAEIEIRCYACIASRCMRFSALQRAGIAEISGD